MNIGDEKKFFKANLISVNSISLILGVVLVLFAAGSLFSQSAEASSGLGQSTQVQANTGQQTAERAEENTFQGQTLSKEKADVQKFGLIAAAAAFGLGAIGAGIAIANVGSAAMGAIGEKPEIAGQALIFIALAEGLVVFGFITALMILGKI